MGIRALAFFSALSIMTAGPHGGAARSPGAFSRTAGAGRSQGWSPRSQSAVPILIPFSPFPFAPFSGFPNPCFADPSCYPAPFAPPSPAPAPPPAVIFIPPQTPAPPPQPIVRNDPPVETPPAAPAPTPASPPAANVPPRPAPPDSYPAVLVLKTERAYSVRSYQVKGRTLRFVTTRGETISVPAALLDRVFPATGSSQ